MQEMSDQDSAGHRGASYYIYTNAPGLLEKADQQGRGQLVNSGQVVAELEGIWHEPFNLDLGGRCISGDLIHASYLYWSQISAIHLLQGAPLHQLIGPNFAVIRASRGPDYSPRPYLKDVVLARVTKTTGDLSLEEVVHTLGLRVS